MCFTCLGVDAPRVLKEGLVLHINASSSELTFLALTDAALSSAIPTHAQISCVLQIN